MPQWQDILKDLEGSVAPAQNTTVVLLGIYMLLAGVLALYVRLLYKKCNGSASDTDSISRTFPLLAVVTTGVIAVVKSSLALSLGLVGALSIVRFRAAIKDPEELVYLFLCIAIGLSLGAEQPLLAVMMTGVATVFVLGMYFTSRRQRQHRLLLTITGDAERHFNGEDDGVLAAVESVAGSYTLQRFDVENGQAQVRIVLGESKPQKTVEIVTKLRRRLPECDLSYVNLNSTL